MYQALRKALPIVSPTSTDVAISATTAVAFAWLLDKGLVQPFAVYLLELYLAL